jgi:hypothetical protein
VPNRSCRVSVIDLEGIEHTAHVTADTLYEAVARGLKAIKSSAWAGEIPEGITTITVCAAQPEVGTPRQDRSVQGVGESSGRIAR